LNAASIRNHVSSRQPLTGPELNLGQCPCRRRWLSAQRRTVGTSSSTGRESCGRSRRGFGLWSPAGGGWCNLRRGGMKNIVPELPITRKGPVRHFARNYRGGWVLLPPSHQIGRRSRELVGIIHAAQRVDLGRSHVFDGDRRLPKLG